MSEKSEKSEKSPNRTRTRDELIVMNQGLVYDLAAQLSAERRRHHDFVEDLRGEGFKALVAAADSYNPELCEFSTYATVAIINEMWKFIQKERQYQSRRKSLAFDPTKNNELASSDVLIDTPPDEYGLMISSSVEKALASLSDRDRELIQMRFFDDLTLREIGEKMGYTLQAADQALRRALARMRTIVDPDVLHERSGRIPNRRQRKSVKDEVSDLIDAGA